MSRIGWYYFLLLISKKYFYFCLAPTFWSSFILFLRYMILREGSGSGQILECLTKMFYYTSWRKPSIMPRIYLGLKFRALGMLCKCSTAELLLPQEISLKQLKKLTTDSSSYPQDRVSLCRRLASNSSCLSFPSAGLIGVCHHAQHKIFFFYCFTKTYRGLQYCLPITRWGLQWSICLFP